MNIGHVWRIKAGCEGLYQERHAVVWPELEQLFARMGVRQYHIYRWGAMVFSHLEVDDYDTLKRGYGADPVALRWEQAFGGILEYPNADPEWGWPEELQHVWSLPPQAKPSDRGNDGADRRNDVT